MNAHATLLERRELAVDVVEAGGRPLTPALFGGIGALGLEEISLGAETNDHALALGDRKAMVVRPEFDVTLAYNPESILIPVARVEGIGFAALRADSVSGGSIVGGQGGVVRLDGSPDPIGPKTLFVELGSDGAGLTGNSRAAQWMILDQLVDEARGRIPADATGALPAHGQPDAHGRREARLCAAVPHWRGFRHCVLPRLLSDFDRFQRRRRT